MSAVNEHAAIGRSVPRVDGAGKVTGVTRFAGDVQVPGTAASASSSAPWTCRGRTRR
jgi:CO/xanthine dehydrogenase Mo-binding subunit